MLLALANACPIKNVCIQTAIDLTCRAVVQQAGLLHISWAELRTTQGYAMFGLQGPTTICRKGPSSIMHDTHSVIRSSQRNGSTGGQFTKVMLLSWLNIIYQVGIQVGQKHNVRTLDISIIRHCSSRHACQMEYMHNNNNKIMAVCQARYIHRGKYCK